MEPQIATPHAIFVAGALFISYLLVSVFVLPFFSAQGKFWRSQQWTGETDRMFSRWRARYDALTKTNEMVLEGYRKFEKKAFGFPQFSSAPVLVLSGQQLHEMLSMTDSDVDPKIPLDNEIAHDRTIGDLGRAHFEIIRKQLTRRLPLLTTDVFEELRLGMEDTWKATADSWTTVKVYPTTMSIVSRAANRVFSGKVLCRMPEYLEHSLQYTMGVFNAGRSFKSYPKWMHPIIHPFIKRPINKSLEICRRYSMPMIQERIKKMETDPKYEPPQDAMTWLIEQQLRDEKTNPTERDRNLICRRMIFLNMVAIHTTSISTTNTIMDVFTSPRKAEFLEGLREECDRVLAEYGGVWTKDAVNKLYRVDSALRESLRFQSLAEISIRRMVVNPNGINLSGTHVPHGVTLGAAASAIHLDPEIYTDALEYNAFRFSQPREEYMARVKAAGGTSAISSASDRDEILQIKNQSMVSYGEDFFGFGHGMHACPGRFFASQEMKLMLAHILTNYEIKIEGERPPNKSNNGNSWPRPEWEMQVRLRKPIA